MPNSSLKQLQKLKRNKIYLTISIFFVLILVIWVIFSITLSNVREQVDPKIIALTKPFSPVLDKEVFELINQKHAYSEEELSLFPIYKIIFNKQKRSEMLIPIEFDETLLAPTSKNTPAPTEIKKTAPSTNKP